MPQRVTLGDLLISRKYTGRPGKQKSKSGSGSGDGSSSGSISSGSGSCSGNNNNSCNSTLCLKFGPFF